MQARSRFIFASVALIWVAIGCLELYGHWYRDVFREGYERGYQHTAIYIRHCGSFPAREWRDKAYWHAGATDAQWWIDSVNGSPVRPRFRDDSMMHAPASD